MQKQNKLDIAKIFRTGNISFVKNFSKSSLENLEFALTIGFENAVQSGNLKNIKFLLSSKEIVKNTDIHYENDYALSFSALNGHLETVKYLLTSKELKEHSNIHVGGNSSLRWASQANHLNVVEYLLSSPELKEHANINLASSITGSNAFMEACELNSLDVARYLSQRQDLDSKKALYNLNRDGKDGFMLACENLDKSTDIIDFIVFEMNFQPTEIHNKYFNDNENHKNISYAKKTISIRDLNEKLSSDLINKRWISAKIKI